MKLWKPRRQQQEQSEQIESKKKLSLTKKEKQFLLFLAGFYFLIGPFQTTALLIIHYDLPLVQVVDNYGGWAFITLVTFGAYKFYKSGHFDEAINDMLDSFRSKKKKKE